MKQSWVEKEQIRNNEETEPKQKQHPVVDETGDGSKVRCCKEQYCIGTWNIRSMNQSKWSEHQHFRNRRTKMDWNLTQMTIISTTVGKNPLEEMEYPSHSTKRVWNAVLGCNLKSDRMISVSFQGKPFNITVIQVCAPTSNAEEAESEWFYENL